MIGLDYNNIFMNILKSRFSAYKSSKFEHFQNVIMLYLFYKFLRYIRCNFQNSHAYIQFSTKVFSFWEKTGSILKENGKIFTRKWSSSYFCKKLRPVLISDMDNLLLTYQVLISCVDNAVWSVWKLMIIGFLLFKSS